MNSSVAQAKIWRFAHAQFDERTHELTVNGEPVRLEDKPLAVLLCLLRADGALVTKEGLFDSVWAGRVVTDGVLSQAVRRIREVLGDEQRELLRTVHGHGFRLDVPVVVDDDHASGMQQAIRARSEPSNPATAQRSPKHNLPLRRSQFVGREQEIEQVTALIGQYPLVTLLGFGGMGKTRLALEVATAQLEHFPDGVYFVDLSPLADGELLPWAVAEALGQPVTASGPEAALAALRVSLSTRRELIILDNCEHLIDAAAQFAQDLLEFCGELCLLATSREPLAIEAEQVYRVPALNRSGTAGASEAARLFIARAQAVDQAFEVDETLPLVETLCDRLDGLPLAIELAAARVAHLSLTELLERLDDRFNVLTAGKRGRPGRQQTLQALIDWSYALLEPGEQRLLARLSVFSGGFTLKAAEGVCCSGLNRSALDLITTLVDKSLVVREGGGVSTRYKLLETLRAYGADRLTEAGELEAIRTRHADWLLDYLYSFTFDDQTQNYRVADQLMPDLDNFRAAMDWYEATGELEECSRLTVGLALLWIVAYPVEGARRLRRTADLTGLPDASRAQCLAVACTVAFVNSDWDSCRELGQAALALGADDDYQVHSIGHVLTLIANPEEHARVREELEWIVEYCETRKYRQSARYMGAFLLMLDLIQGRRREVAALAESTGPITDLSPSHSVSRYLIITACLLDRQADAALKQAGMLTAAIPNSATVYTLAFMSAHVLHGIAAAETGQLELARDKLTVATRLLFERPVALIDSECALGFAALRAASGDWAGCCRLLHSIQSTYSTVPMPFRMVHWVMLSQDYLARARSELSAEQFDAASQAGCALPLADALREEMAQVPA